MKFLTALIVSGALLVVPLCAGVGARVRTSVKAKSPKTTKVRKTANKKRSTKHQVKPLNLGKQ
jgi:hypothetical protein